MLRRLPGRSLATLGMTSYHRTALPPYRLTALPPCRLSIISEDLIERVNDRVRAGRRCRSRRPHAQRRSHACR